MNGTISLPLARVPYLGRSGILGAAAEFATDVEESEEKRARSKILRCLASRSSIALADFTYDSLCEGREL